MKILFLCKRRPQNRDLIERPYGRFYNLPKHLASMGHDVDLLLASYIAEPAITLKREGMRLHSYQMFPNVYGFYAYASTLIETLKPDVVVCFSDTWFGILGGLLTKKTNISLVIDAYDNYEAYLPKAWPLHWMWRRAQIGRASCRERV